MAGEMAKELLLSGQRVLPAQLLEDGFQFHYPDLKEALADLMPREG
jgi:NAD dependent epimerase/dehydratase family enzyme